MHPPGHCRCDSRDPGEQTWEEVSASRLEPNLVEYPSDTAIITGLDNQPFSKSYDNVVAIKKLA
jgi:hypothetical protein